MSLKDDWKAGKLENERRYYCRLKYCGNTIVTYKGEYLMHDRFDAIKRDDELEILDIVPSYEKLQELKCLLKECKEYIATIYNGASGCYLDSIKDTAYHDGKYLLTKINTAIGESEE